MDLSSLYHFLRTAIPSYIIWLALVSSSLTLPTQQVFAREFEELQLIFRSHKARAIKLRSLPQERFLAGEFQSLNHWIEQAERELAEEEEERFEKLIDLIGVQLDLIDSHILQLSAKEEVMKVLEETQRLEGKAKTIRAEVVELERSLGGVLSAPPPPKPSAPSTSAPVKNTGYNPQMKQPRQQSARPQPTGTR